jgi:anti-sigma factor RsiW
MNCIEALPMLHQYLDGDLSGQEAKGLKEHLMACPACRNRLQQLEKVEALVQSWPAPQLPEGITERIMNALPPERRTGSWNRWFRKHPAVSVAAVFALVMMGSFLTGWNQDKELLVKGSDLESVVIKGDTVYVPAGKTIAGNLTVENGRLEVEGDIKGDIVVIDGKVNLASTAHISGQVTQIDEAFSWLWFKMSHWMSH